MTAARVRIDEPAKAQAHVPLTRSESRFADWQRAYGRRLIVIDLFGVALATGLAQWVRFNELPELAGDENFLRYYANHNYTYVSVFIAVAWMLALAANRSRSPRVIGSGAEEYRRVILATLSTFGAVAIFSMLLKLEIARGYLMIALPTGIAVLTLFRYLARRQVIRARASGECITRVLVVGNAPAVRDFTQALAREPWSEYRVVGACVSGEEIPQLIDVPGVGTVRTFGDESNIASAVAATDCRAVAVTAIDRLDGRGIRDLSWELEEHNIDLLVAPGVMDVAVPRLEMRPVAGLPLIHVEKPRYHGAKRFEKRLFDVLFSAMVLLCGLPILLLVALAIKLTSRGPVFYRSERIGIDGKPFEMIKFRTMVQGADKMVTDLASQNESEGGVLFKIKEDPRITPIGRVLRKFSIDELPQFLNVLKHDMSVVGPRPPLACEVTSYDDFSKKRLLVKPGITGLWQVSGRSDLSWEDSVRLDMFYVENWTMISDMVIALKTVRAVFGRAGAY